MFGMGTTFDPASRGFPFMFLPAPYNDDSFQGDQVRGFGFLHDGSTDTVFRFHASTVFVERPPTNLFPNPGGIPVASPTDDPATAQQKVLANIQLRRQIEAFMLAFDSNMAPIVGQQATLAAWSGDDVQARIALFEARAAAGECDLVVHGQARGRAVGFLYDPATARFIPDRAHKQPVADADLRALARDADLTFTAVPPGSGRRIGIDRDLDGVLDGDEGSGHLAQVW